MVGNPTLLWRVGGPLSIGRAIMRAVLLVLIIAVVALIAALQTGLINISQTRPATAPTLEAGDGAIRTQAGQAPAFEVETGSVGVGTREANVAVPEVQVKRGQATVEVPAVEVRRAGEEANQNAAR
jgi:phage baseplate assembly protein gpV